MNTQLNTLSEEGKSIGKGKIQHPAARYLDSLKNKKEEEMKLLVKCDVCGKECASGEWLSDCEKDYCKTCLTTEKLKMRAVDPEMTEENTELFRITEEEKVSFNRKDFPELTLKV